MMTHEDIQADLSLFALGSLDAEEQRIVEEHVSGCKSCQGELAEWRKVIGLMPMGLEDTAAPNLKPALLQRARGTATKGRKVIAFPRWTALPLAAAAVALIALAVARESEWRSRIASEQGTVATLRQELAATNGKLDEVARVLTAREGDVAALRAALDTARESLGLLQARDLTLVRLSQPEAAAPAEGHALIGHAAGRALFYAFELPEVPKDKTYELWWITEKEGPINAGLFVPGPDGLARIEAALPVSSGAVQAAAVTIEPAGGKPKPTGPMVLLGKLEAAL